MQSRISKSFYGTRVSMYPGRVLRKIVINKTIILT